MESGFARGPAEVTCALYELRDAGVTAISPWLTIDGEQTFPLPSLEGHTGLVILDLVQEHDSLKLSGGCEVLWQVTQLETLRLPGIPASFYEQSEQLTRLQLLRTLQLSEYNCGELPSGLSALTACASLRMPGSVLWDSWERLRQLHCQLRELCLSNGHLGRVPAEVFSLTNLTHLDLGTTPPHLISAASRRMLPTMLSKSVFPAPSSAWLLPAGPARAAAASASADHPCSAAALVPPPSRDPAGTPLLPLLWYPALAGLLLLPLLASAAPLAPLMALPAVLLAVM